MRRACGRSSRVQGIRWELWGVVIHGLLSCSLADESRAAEAQGFSGSGVVVEEIDPGSALEQAGVQAGDVLIAWQRLPDPPANPQADQGKIESVFDWLWLALEQAPRGTIVLHGRRIEELKECRVRPGEWMAKIRPVLPESTLADYSRAADLIAAGELEEAADLWREVKNAVAETADWRLRSGLSLRMAEIWARAKAWERAGSEYRFALETAEDPRSRAAIWKATGSSYARRGVIEDAATAYRTALDILEQEVGDSLAVAAILNNLGNLARKRSDLDQAEEWVQRALRIRQEQAPESLAVASSLNNLGLVAWNRGQLDRAEEYHQRALAIRERLAPDSPTLTSSLNNLGTVAWNRGDLDRAVEFYQRTLAIREGLAPESRDVVIALNNLGVVVWQRGDLDHAEGLYQRALDIGEQIAPDSLLAASILNNLGLIAWSRGDLDQAEGHHQRALAIREQLAPDSLDFAVSLNSLGILAKDRGDPDRAIELCRRFLDITKKIAPESLHVASGLTNLGILAWTDGDRGQATDFFEQALAIQQKHAPDSLEVAQSLNNLGDLAHERGDLDRAAELYHGALAIQDRLSPESLAQALTLNNLGKVAQRGGDLGSATELHQRALAIRAKLAPGSSAEAESLEDLAAVYRKSDHPEESLDHYLRSIDALEAQIEKLGGTEKLRADFRSRHEATYRGAIELLLQQNRSEEAFAVLERSRARSFLTLLAEKDLLFEADLPEELDRTRRRLAILHDRAFHELALLSPVEEPEKVEALQKELTRLLREREEVVETIRRESPGFAALQYPRPLTLRETRAALDPGTVMLSFSVGRETTDLFVVTRDLAFRVHTIAMGEDELQRQVELLRDLIRHTESSTSIAAMRTADLEDVSERLYRSLIEPAAEVVATGERLLIIPDGPLHLLPFAALKGPDGTFLAEWKPLHSVLSATVYAELKKSRSQLRPPGDGEPRVLITAFGDPHYPERLTRGKAEEIADVRVRSAVERDLLSWTPLRYTRQEIERITALYPAGASRTYLGADATEERAKSTDRDALIVHFAAHGYTDDRFPLSSGLALTIPEDLTEDRDNGLLQVWEIFECLRLEADLVVLSACQTGVGKEQGGEGLIGLTRAFQYAGARSVAATLWNVNDQATAELMVRFYRHLRSGKPKDEALRAAQLELIRGSIEVAGEGGDAVARDWSSPFYWAAFQIYGDWR